ncbi:MAG: hypothetical protein M9934_06930 [Thermomicrobiales bacterium]|nr:hypothetical protein [Thermomicrobiales bacterium]MCO5218732.1 hypothetical protein [Thermomicrobiales bacterium]MCO5228004.1 hypothetical protein [Thermomicrobiales bacterium]
MAIQNIYDAERVLKFVESEPDQPQGDQPDSAQLSSLSSIIVRPYHLRDASMLSQFQVRHELRFPESSYERPGLMQLAMRRILHAEGSDLPLYVALSSTGNRRLGALQCARQPADDRWHLQFLSMAENEDEFDVPVALLEHAVVAAGQCGARRILARLDVESSLLSALRAVGFTAYTREQVYLLDQTTSVRRSAGVRTQAKSDVWSMHQLYIQTTPRDVQNAEALTSHAWDVDTEGRSQRGWFITSQNGVGAYVRVRTSRHYHVLDVLVAPEMRTQLQDVIVGVRSILAEETPRPIYLLLRGYQLDLANGISSHLQELVSEQHLMVRYTTATSPGSLRLAEAFELLRPAEADPQRVPSFSVRSQHEHC